MCISNSIFSKVNETENETEINEIEILRIKYAVLSNAKNYTQLYTQYIFITSSFSLGLLIII